MLMLPCGDILRTFGPGNTWGVVRIQACALGTPNYFLVRRCRFVEMAALSLFSLRKLTACSFPFSLSPGSSAAGDSAALDL